jgi:hypothetical protein
MSFHIYLQNSLFMEVHEWATQEKRARTISPYLPSSKYVDLSYEIDLVRASTNAYRLAADNNKKRKKDTIFTT